MSCQPHPQPFIRRRAAQRGRSSGATLLLPLLAMSPAALAHPGHALLDSGFIAGLLHPLAGLDHLLAMLLVGLWAGQLGGRARLALPLGFLLPLAAGAALAMNRWALPQAAAGVAASLLTLGLLVAAAGRLPALLALALTALFALFHGSAHGSELPALAQPAAYALGFVCSCAALIGAGLWLRPARGAWLARGAGALAIAVGVAQALG